MENEGKDATGGSSPEIARKAFEQATLDLAIEGIRIDPESVEPLASYRNGGMTYAEACDAMRRRHATA